MGSRKLELIQIFDDGQSAGLKRLMDPMRIVSVSSVEKQQHAEQYLVYFGLADKPRLGYCSFFLSVALCQLCRAI